MTQLLTTRQVQRLLSALECLDGYERVTKDGGNERIVREFFKLGPGLRMQVAKMQATLRQVMEEFHAARKAVLLEVTGGDPFIDPKTQPELFARFSAREDDLMGARHPVVLPLITVEELKLDTNPIPAGVLAGLLPVIEDVDAPATKAAA